MRKGLTLYDILHYTTYMMSGCTWSERRSKSQRWFCCQPM